jgi:hypothetical protein
LDRGELNTRRIVTRNRRAGRHSEKHGTGHTKCRYAA